MSTTNSKQPPAHNGNGSKQLNDVIKLLPSVEKSMNAMQSKFGSINAMQGEVNDFKKQTLTTLGQLITAINSLVAANNSLVAEVSALRNKVVALDREIGTLKNDIPSSVTAMTQTTQSNTKQTNGLVKEVEKLAATMQTGINTHVNWKYLLKGLVVILALTIGYMFYGEYYRDQRIANIENTVQEMYSYFPKRTQNSGDRTNQAEQSQPSDNGKNRKKNKGR